MIAAKLWQAGMYTFLADVAGWLHQRAVPCHLALVLQHNIYIILLGSFTLQHCSIGSPST